MRQFQVLRYVRRATIGAALAALSVGLTIVPATASTPGDLGATSAPQFLGEDILPTGLIFEGTEVGGLSGLTYDAVRDVYYAISDDRSHIDPARFYTLRIDLADGSLDDEDVSVVGVTTLRDPRGRAFAPSSLDPESIALTEERTLVITSEGDASLLIDPFVREFGLSGRQLANLPVPGYYDPAPDGTSGVRTNLGFESGGFTPDGDYFFTGTENALAQDGPTATLTTASPSRLLRYDSAGRLDREFVYVVEPVQEAPTPSDAFAINGLVDLLPLTPTRLIAMERSFSVGAGNDVRLYFVDTARATNVRGRAALPADLLALRPVDKFLLFDLDALGVTLDNLEGLTFGPRQPDGSQTVLIVSDNNFSPTQFTQFLAFTIG
ncbi:MAG: esterase-like activity of phytase family protein [Geodermatophilaceae bacterium]|nr:esterase-like activity of phytase family protein [Geodermatophilaceae bacterium]